jgi:DNA excision repair protein ERCC-1
LPSVNAQARNAIVVNRRQTGNPVLKFIRNVRWVYGDIVPDYLLGQTTCALYISLRYHLLHPDYLYFRIRELQKGFRLRVILCHVDLEDVIKPLHEVIKTALLHDCSLLCAWSLEECARYLETLKTYENKPADNIQERTDNDYLSRMTSALTSVRHVNKTDVLTLGSTFGTLAGIFGASMEDLARCPGIGERKVKRLYDAFHEPFRRTTKQLRLDEAVTKKTQAVDTELVAPVDSSTKPVESSNTGEGASESKADEPNLSVRKALDAAHAKIVKRKVGSRTETSMKDMCSNTTQAPPAPVNIEVIDIT